MIADHNHTSNRQFIDSFMDWLRLIHYYFKDVIPYHYNVNSVWRPLSMPMIRKISFFFAFCVLAVCVCVSCRNILIEEKGTLRSNICHALLFVFFPRLDWCVVTTNIALGKGRELSNTLKWMRSHGPPLALELWVFESSFSCELSFC